MPFTPDANQDNAKPTPGFVPDNSSQDKGSIIDSIKNAYNQMQDRNLNVGRGVADNFVDTPELPGVDSDPVARVAGKALGVTSSIIGGGQLASANLPEAAGFMGGLGRTAVNAGVGGLQGYLQKPGDDQTRTGNAVRGGALAGLVSGAGEAISSGGKKLADKAMQYATGMRKYIPGVGNSLVDEGLIGTKGMLENQVGEKLPQVEQEVQDIVKNIPGTRPTTDIANEVRGVGDKFKLPSGEVPGNVAPYSQKVDDAAKSVQNMGGSGGYSFDTGAGELSAPDLLKLKRQGDWLGYTASGNPATSLEAEIGQAQGDASRKALSQMSGGQVPDALKREQALILAKKALTKPETIHQGVGSNLAFHRLPFGSIGGSALAQASQKGAGSLGDLMSNPYILQLLVNNSTRNDNQK